MNWISVNDRLPDNDEYVFVKFQHHPDCTDQVLWFAQYTEGGWYGNEINLRMVKLEGVPICWHPIPKSSDIPIKMS